MSQEHIPQLFRQRIQEANEKQLEELDLSNEFGANESQKLTRIPDEVEERPSKLSSSRQLNVYINQEGERIAKVQEGDERENSSKQKSNTMTTKILVLESNPRGTDQLLLNQEIRDLEATLRNSSQGNNFAIKPELAVRIQDLQPTILREKPRLVHFCGHGTDSQGLIVQTQAGTPQPLSTSALADLFKIFSHQIECVILNACYSQVQAAEINQHINYVIGTTSAIKDRVALLFSQGFYGALGEGESIESAYQLGLNRIELEMDVNNHPERKLVPVESELEHRFSNRKPELIYF